MPDAASSAHAVVVPSCVSVALAGVLSRSRPDANDAVVIELVGEIDVGAVNALARRLAAARDAGHRRVVVDLSAVTVVFGAQTTSQLCDALGRRNRSVSVTVIGGPVPVRRLLNCEPINPPDQPAVSSVMAASSERPRSTIFNARCARRSRVAAVERPKEFVTKPDGSRSIGKQASVPPNGEPQPGSDPAAIGLERQVRACRCSRVVSAAGARQQDSSKPGRRRLKPVTKQSPREIADA